MQELGIKVDNIIEQIKSDVNPDIKNKLVDSLNIMAKELKFMDEQFDYKNSNKEYKKQLDIVLTKINNLKQIY